MVAEHRDLEAGGDGGHAVVELADAVRSGAQEHVVAAQEQHVRVGLPQQAEGVVERLPRRGRAEVEVRSEGQGQGRTAGIAADRDLVALQPDLRGAREEPPQLRRPAADVDGGQEFLEPAVALAVGPPLPSHTTSVAEARSLVSQ
jgi:hypothetical protein